MKVLVVNYEDLPESERYQQPNNGCGMKYANYLKVEIPGKPTIYYSDAMEPEDANFRRDLSWIKDLVLQAYQVGKESK